MSYILDFIKNVKENFRMEQITDIQVEKGLELRKAGKTVKQIMKELNLDIASEYLVMASELLEYKSRSLLPKKENVSDEYELTFIIGAEPNNPPNSADSPTPFPITGIILTAVVFLLIIPIAISSAIIPAIVVVGVSPGIAIISKPTEQTEVIASNLSKVK